MMHRRKPEQAGVRISDEEYSRLESKLDTLRNEFLACKRKLSSKCEALLILSQELDQCRSERDQFKLMAEQLRERYQTMKKQLSGLPMGSQSDTSVHRQHTGLQGQNVTKLLYDSRDNNKALQFELEDLKQKLHDAQGDIKLLREQIARQRVGTTDEGMNTRHFPAHEREELVQKLEASKDQYIQLERDLQTVLDEKEELVTERDVYKTKYERLNQELNYILKGDENRVVDIDALVMENKYLQERMKQMEEEKSMAMAAVSKYKGLLEKKKNKGCMKLGQNRGPGMIITQKQVKQVLEAPGPVIATPQAMSDLQALAGALLDTVNDKNLALSHQRKTNKILGLRVAELEKKLKTLEVAGLWSVPSDVSASLEKLRQECDDVKTLIPRQSSETSELSPSEHDRDSELETVTPLDSPLTTPEASPSHVTGPLGHLELEDLDLLPTKEVSCTKHNVRDDMESSTNQQFGFSLADTDFAEFSSKGICNLDENTITRNINFQIIENFPDSADCFKDDVKRPVIEDHVSEHLHIHEDNLNNNEEEECISEVSGGMDTLNIHVYNEDQLVSSEFDETENEDDDFRLDENCQNDAESFYADELKDDGVNTKGKMVYSKDHENEDVFDESEDTEASEKIGLLMESMAKKMCNISHETVEAGSPVNKHCMNIHEDVGGIKHMVGVASSEATPPASPSKNSPLLNGQRQSQEEFTSETDDPHDIEC